MLFVRTLVLIEKISKMFDHQGLYLLLVLTSALITYTQQQDPDFLAFFKKSQADCAKEVGADPQQIGKNWVANSFPNDDKFKCYFKCLFLKIGSMNDKGDVVDDVLKKVSAPFNDANTDTEIVLECGGIEGSDLCDTAYKLAACVRAAQLD